MYFLKTENSFDAAHFLWGYDGKCRNLHGHRWRVTAEIGSEALEAEGQTRDMVVDFGDLKRPDGASATISTTAWSWKTGSLLQNETLAALLAEAGSSYRRCPFRPTAENFARYFYEKLSERGYSVRRVEVYETPSNCAAYEE